MVIVNASNCTNLSCVYVIVTKVHLHVVGVILKVIIMMVFSRLVMRICK